VEIRNTASSGHGQRRRARPLNFTPQPYWFPVGTSSSGNPSTGSSHCLALVSLMPFVPEEKSSKHEFANVRRGEVTFQGVSTSGSAGGGSAAMRRTPQNTAVVTVLTRAASKSNRLFTAIAQRVEKGEILEVPPAWTVLLRASFSSNGHPFCVQKSKACFLMQPYRSRGVSPMQILTWAETNGEFAPACEA